MAESAARPGLRVGLTGGVASGKSSVAAMFQALGAAVIDTDTVARDVVAPGEPALQEIRSAFGPGVLTADGQLDRAALRRRVFADEAERQRLERILHPRIRRRTLALADAASGPYLMIVVPLLLESGFVEFVDRVLVVDCPDSEQLRRLLRRDGESEAQARRIIRAQADRAQRLAVADDVIDNAGSLDQTRAQVAALHQRYLLLAARRRGDADCGQDTGSAE